MFYKYRYNIEFIGLNYCSNFGIFLFYQYWEKIFRQCKANQKILEEYLISLDIYPMKENIVFTF